MSKIPVLLLISRTIDLNILNHSPRFPRYRFFSLTAIEYLENDRFRHKAQALQNALYRKIERVGAEYLLAHLGLAFDRYPVEFLTALLEIQVLYPRLKIGLDKGLCYAIQSLRASAVPSLEDSNLTARLAQGPRLFNSDEETDALAACLH